MSPEARGTFMVSRDKLGGEFKSSRDIWKVITENNLYNTILCNIVFCVYDEVLSSYNRILKMGMGDLS